MNATRKSGYSALIFLLVVTVVFIGLQYLFPDVLTALRRNPTKLSHGEWWRIVTPLLVQSDGVGQIITNILGLLVFGFATLRAFGALRFLILYFVGGLIGEVFGYAWNPYGAGNSVAICGLIGGLLVVLYFRRERVPPLIYMLSLYFVAGLIGFATGSWILTAVLIGVACVLQFVLSNLHNRGKTIGPIVAVIALLGSVTLVWLHDLHGPSILAGVIVAYFLPTRSQVDSESPKMWVKL